MDRERDLDSPVLTRSQGAADIDGNHTDIICTNFNDKLFVIVTQYGKLGTLILVNKDVALDGPKENATYNTKVLLGKDDTMSNLLARGLAEKIGVQKPILFALALKDTNPGTLRTIGDLILQHKCW